jgi:hypothetical protein
MILRLLMRSVLSLNILHTRTRTGVLRSDAAGRHPSLTWIELRCFETYCHHLTSKPGLPAISTYSHHFPPDYKGVLNCT